MRSHDDPAVDRVIVYQVVRDQVVVGLAGIVADEYPSGVAKDDVVGHDRMIDSGQMDSLAAVVVFTGFERRQARTRERRNYQTLVIIEYPVTHDGDSGGVGDQDSFDFGILHLNPPPPQRWQGQDYRYRRCRHRWPSRQRRWRWCRCLPPCPLPLLRGHLGRRPRGGGGDWKNN